MVLLRTVNRGLRSRGGVQWEALAPDNYYSAQRGNTAPTGGTRRSVHEQVLHRGACTRAGNCHLNPVHNVSPRDFCTQLWDSRPWKQCPILFPSSHFSPLPLPIARCVSWLGPASPARLFTIPVAFCAGILPKYIVVYRKSIPLRSELLLDPPPPSLKSLDSDYRENSLLFLWSEEIGQTGGSPRGCRDKMTAEANLENWPVCVKPGNSAVTKRRGRSARSLKMDTVFTWQTERRLSYFQLLL